MKIFLTRVHGGRYLLTALKPIIRTIRGTPHLDAFSQPGEPIDVRHLCAAGIVALLGHELPELTPTKITIEASVVGIAKKTLAEKESE